MSNSDSIYPISIVMSMTNLTARQIRYYETQGLIKPARSKGNQRLYTSKDVETLLLIKNLLEKGLNLDGIKSIFNNNDSSTLENNNPKVISNNSDLEIINSNKQFIPKLTSLYPVNNQEALNKWLQHKKK